MITLTALYGQTSNNFFQHIHLDAFCRTHKLPFRNPYLSAYYKTYPNLAKQGYGTPTWWLRTRIKKGWVPILHFDDPAKEFTTEYADMLLSKRNIFCEGWHFRTSKAELERYRPLYQELFKPAIDTDTLDQQYLLRPNGEAILAVHIRRGDYKEWLGGKYYFEDEVYIQRIADTLQMLNRPYKVILFSNDPDLQVDKYKQRFGHVLHSTNPVATDHYLCPDVITSWVP